MTLVGISFPFRKQNGQFPAIDTDAQAVRSNVMALFNLPLRGRVMRPLLGTSVYQLVFDPVDALFRMRMDALVRATIARGEPRASVISVSTEVKSTTVTVNIVYSVNGIQDNVSVNLERPT